MEVHGVQEVVGGAVPVRQGREVPLGLDELEERGVVVDHA